MRSLVRVFCGVLVAVSFGFAGALFGGQAVAAERAASQVPRSLDALYPPVADRPAYLFHMLVLDESFTGIVVDVLEGDLSGARDNFESFRSQYAEVRRLVPEWESYYPLEPVEQLGAAFASGDQGHLMAAFGEVGKTCHHCHTATMVPVQQRYHWGDFGAVTVADPLTHETVDFARFKQHLSMNLTGIRVDLRQGQNENALRQFDAFKARFESLKGSCLTCHDRDGLSFVDGEVTGVVDQLGSALREPHPSLEAVGKLLQAIGRESCSKCHLVHVPAAVAKTASR